LRGCSSSIHIILISVENVNFLFLSLNKKKLGRGIKGRLRACQLPINEKEFKRGSFGGGVWGANSQKKLAKKYSRTKI
tara:strand:+ start:1522 stop:1755 length:234 start_codon:yes stop_codon:yes gene_type:complete